MPPYRTAYEYYIIVIPIFYLIFDCRASIAITFFKCDLGTRRVGGRIRILLGLSALSDIGAIANINMAITTKIVFLI